MPSCSYNVLENNVLVSLVNFLFYIKRENAACISLDHKRNRVFRKLQVFKKSLSDLSERNFISSNDKSPNRKKIV